jgi:hypothetical protein
MATLCLVFAMFFVMILYLYTPPLTFIDPIYHLVQNPDGTIKLVGLDTDTPPDESRIALLLIISCLSLFFNAFNHTMLPEPKPLRPRYVRKRRAVRGGRRSNDHLDWD